MRRFYLPGKGRFFVATNRFWQVNLLSFMFDLKLGRIGCLAIVVSPLISLMSDQVRSLKGLEELRWRYCRLEVEWRNNS